MEQRKTNSLFSQVLMKISIKMKTLSGKTILDKSEKIFLHNYLFLKLFEALCTNTLQLKEIFLQKFEFEVSLGLM